MTEGNHLFPTRCNPRTRTHGAITHNTTRLVRSVFLTSSSLTKSTVEMTQFLAQCLTKFGIKLTKLGVKLMLLKAPPEASPTSWWKCRDEIRLPTCWAIRGSNTSGGEIFRTNPDRPWNPQSLPYSGYRVFPRGKAAGA